MLSLYFCLLTIRISAARPERLITLFLGTLLLLVGPTLAHAQSPHDYRASTPGSIRLKSGQTLTGQIALRGVDGPVQRLLYTSPSGTPKAFPISSVKAFQHGSRYVVNHGIVKKDRALRDQVKEELIVRHVDGRLDLYAPLTARSPAFPYTYFAKGGGIIQKVNYKNLRGALHDHPESAALMASSRTWHWLHRGTFISGMVLSVYGAFGVPDNNSEPNSNVALAIRNIGTDESTFRPDAVLISGVSLVALSFIPRAIKKAKFRKAVRAYNR